MKNKKIIEGYLWVAWGDTSIYPTEESLNHLPEETLCEQLEEFNNKKIRLTIEEIE